MQSTGRRLLSVGGDYRLNGESNGKTPDGHSQSMYRMQPMRVCLFGS